MGDANATGTTGGWCFSPLFIVPAQTNATRQWSPEKRLLFAVFQNAMTTLSRGRKAPTAFRGAHQNQLYEDAVAWVQSDDRDVITSFLEMCDIFDIAPERVRRQLAMTTDGSSEEGKGECRVGPLREPPGRRQVA